MRRTFRKQAAETGNEVTLGGQRRRDRRGLLATTALQAGAVLVLVFPAARPALAQAPTARPVGGRVVAGQASIQQNTAATTVNQSTQRAAVDWTSYDIGSQHTVIYQQPNAASITLNRVTGPDPSQIAGKIIANGQIAIVNPSGVVFHAGSIVDVQSLMVSSANVSNKNFMAGRMVFDQPGNPDAKISNAGNITVKATGLAALMAPQVANTGVITARMGHVVLAGGEAHTVDLYGDGLMSVDVTREVRHTPAGQTALVTNTGTILADGGTIVLTAKAADGIVQNLVSARGRLQANSIGDKTGTIVVSALGGSVTIEGTMEAAGRAPGTRGGTVQVAASDTVNVAASARITASGRTGGGVVALGTTPARALAQGTQAGAGIPAGTSRIVRVAAGAKVKADATENGTGGTIALLSTERTSVAGTLSARGGRVGGDGGRVEISSAQTVGLTGLVDTAAPAGKAGTTLLDPATINIGGDTDSAAGADPEIISAGAFNALTGNVVIAATGTVATPASSINLMPGSSTALTAASAQSMTLMTDAGGTINVNVSLTTSGTTTLSLIGGTTAGTGLNVNAPLSSATSLSLSGNTVTVSDALTGSTRVSLQADTLVFATNGSVTTSNGTVAVAPLSARALVIDDAKPTASLSLSTADLALLANASAPPATIVLGDVSTTPSAATATASSIALNTTTIPALDLSANPIALGLYTTGDITQTGTIKLNTTASTPPVFTASASDRVLLGLANTLPSIGAVSGTQVTLGVTGNTTLGGTISAATAAGKMGNGKVAISGDASVTVSAPVSSTTSLSLVGSAVNVNNALTGTNRVSLQADTLTFGTVATVGTDGSVTTINGTVAVAPLSARALVIDNAKPTASLSLSTADVAVLANASAPPAAIVLGDVSTTPSAATATASSIALNTTATPALDLSANPIAIGLYAATGDITQTGTIKLNTTAPTPPVFTAAAGDRVLLGLANTLPSIGAVSGTQITLGTTGAATIGGTVAATTAIGKTGNGQVAITGDASTNVTGTVQSAGGDVSVALSGGTLNVSGIVSASMGGTVTLTSAGALTLSGTVGGDRATTLGGTSIAVNTGAFIEAGRTGTSPVNGTVTFQNALTLSGGTIAADTVATQTVSQTGGTLAANTLTTTGYMFSGGALATGNAIEVTASGLAAGSSISAVGLTIDATNASFTAAGTATSSADLHIVLLDSFSQTSGLIGAAGTLTIAGSAAGTTGAPGTISQSGGTLAAGTTLELYGLGTTAPMLSGAIEAASVQVLAPNAALTFQPGTLGGSPAFTAGGYSLTLICPNCGAGTPAVTITAPTVTAGTGTPDLRLDGATLSLPGTLTVGRLELHSVGNITQGGAITADTLTGSAGYSATTTAGVLPTYTTAASTAGSVTLNNSANMISNLASYTLAKGNAATRGEFALTDARALVVTAGSVVTAADVTINTGASALTVAGSIGACAIDAATGGTLTLTSSGALALAGTVGGERSTSLTGGTVAVTSGAFVEAGRSGTSPLDGTITVTGPLSLSGGVVAANTVTAGTIGQSNGSLLANTLTTTGYTFTGGTLQTGSTLALSSSGIAVGSLVSAAGLTVTASGAAGSTFTTAGMLYSAGNLTILLPVGTGPGSLSQTGGALAATGTVTIAGNSAGTVGASGIIAQSGGTIAAGTGIVLYGLGIGSANLQGTLAAPSVMVLEPGAQVGFAPASLAATPGLTAPGYTLSLHCPGCDGIAPSLTTTGLTLSPSGTPMTVRVDGSTVSLGSTFAAGTLELHSVGDTTQSAAFTAATLQGTAGYTPLTASGQPTYASAGSGTGSVVLTSGNAISTLGLYDTTGGLAVTSTVSLTAFDQLVAGGNQTVALSAPSLTLNDQIRFGTVSNSGFASNSRPFAADSGMFVAATTAATATAFDRVTLQADTIAINAGISAPGGEVAIAPLTAAIAMSVDMSRATGHLSLTTGDLAHVSLIGPAGNTGPQLLQLGSLDGSTRSAGSITFNTALALTNTAATLGLYATGNVIEATGVGITIGRQTAPGTTGTIIGGVGGTVRLGTATDTTPANSFDVLGPFTAGALSVSNIATANAGRSGLTVTGTVSTSSGDLSLLDVGAVLGGTIYGGTLALNGALSAPGQVLTLNARNGSAGSPAITTGTSGTLTAGTLTGSAISQDTGTGYDVLLNGTANQVATLGAFTVGSTATPQGAFRLTDTVDLAVSGSVLAGAVSLLAPDITINGTITAPIYSASSGGTVALTATAAAGTVAMQSGTVGGQISLTVAAPGGLSVTGGTMDAPSVTLSGNTSFTLSAGTLFGDTVAVGGTASQSGGVLHAKNSLTTGGLSFSAGDLYAGNALSFSVPGTTLMGQVVTPMNLTVTGTGINSTATLLAGGTLGITDIGTFSQTGGTIASEAALTVAAAGVVNQTGGAMLSGATLQLKAAGSAGALLTGQLGGGIVQVVEPNAALVFAPSILSGSRHAASLTTVSPGTLTNSYLPNAQTTTLTAAGATAGPNRTSMLLVDGGTLSLGSGTVVLAADTIELHSAGATSQAGGSLQTSALSGTAGYTGTSPALPAVPDYTALTPSVITAATVTLDRAANNVAAITGYQATGGLIVVDAPGAQTSSTGTLLAQTGLTLSGTVRAGKASDPLTATAQAATGMDVAITTTGNLVTSGMLAGRAVGLTAAGAVTQPGGLVVADTLTSSATSISLTRPNQVATLASTTASTGDIAFVDNRNLVVTGPVSAPTGAISIKAVDGTGTASATEPAPGGGARAAATGDLTIGATPTGSASTITGRTVALTGTDVILNGAVGASLIGGGGGTVTIAASGTPTSSSLTTSPGTITANAGSVVGGKVTVGLTAPGGIIVQGGTLDAPTVTFGSTTVLATVSPTVSPTLTLSSGQVYGSTVTVNGAALETGGLLAANALTVTGGLTFTNGTLYAGGSGVLTLAVTGQSLAGTVTTSGSLSVSGTNLTSTAGLFAGGILSIADAGTFTQSAGTLAGAGVTVTAAGLVDQSGGAIESTGTLLLRGYGTGAATVAGQLGGQTIEVIEPAAAVVFAPTAFAAGDTHPLRGAATLGTTTLALDYLCPGCTPLTVNTLTVTTTTAATPSANRPDILRVDAGSLTLGGPLGSANVLAADAIELHSQTFTTQQATSQTAAASLETGTLSGSAGYAVSSAVLPGYSIPSAQTRAGGYGVSAAVSGATVTLDNTANNVAVLSSYQVRGDDASRAGLILQDQPVSQTKSDGTTLAANGLLVTGTVRSGPAADPLDASAALATGNDTVLRVSGAGQSLQIGNASTPGAIVGGRTVSLTAAGGDITEGGSGAIVAGTLNANAGGGVQLATAGGSGQIGNQIAVLSGIAAGNGAVTVQDSRSVTVTGPVSATGAIALSAQNGAGTPSAAEGQSAGNLTLSGPVSAGGDVALTANGTLSGSSVSTPGTVALRAGGDVTVGGISANLLTGSAGRSFTAAGAFPNVTNVVASAGGLTVTDGAALSLTGLSSGSTSATLNALSFTLAGDLYAGGTLRLEATTAGITQNTGTVAATGPVLLTGASDTTALPGSIVQNAGTVASGTSVTLLASGDTAQGSAGTVAAPIVQVISQNGTNSFGASQSAQVTLGSAALIGRPVSVRLDGQTLALTQAVAAGTVTLHAATSASEAPGSSIVANLLTGTTGYAPSGTDGAGLPTYATLGPASPGSGSATLLSSGNMIARLGDVAARSGLALNDGASLVIGGTVNSPGAPVSISLTGANSTLSVGDATSPSAVLAGSTVMVVVPGAITQAPGALVAAGTLTGSAATANLSPSAGNQVLQLGAFTTGGDFTLANGRDLSVTGAVVAGSNPPAATTPVLTLGVAGALDLNGGSLTAGTVAMTATGALTETNGSIVANTLSLAASQITANSAGNAVNTLSSAVAPGGVAFTDAASLTTTGPVRAAANPITLQVGGDLVTTDVVSTGGAVTFSVNGNITVAATSAVIGASVATQSGGATNVAGTVTSQGALSVAANGVTFSTSSAVQAASATVDAGGSTLTQNGVLGVSGRLTEVAGTITQAGQVTVGAALNQTAGTAVIAGTTVANAYALTASAAATLAGVETAPLITVTAPSITLANGTIVTGGVPQTATTPIAGLPTVRTAGLGFFLETGSKLVQTGQTVVRPITGSPQATVRVDLTAGSGSILFASLSAPLGNIILDIGTGTAAGHVDVHQLTVLRAGNGVTSAGLVDLLGTVAGLPGTAAAGISTINTPGRDYRINSCAISSVNCVILQPQVVPVGDPLKELVLNFFREQDGDDNLLLPNVTDQGM